MSSKNFSFNLFAVKDGKEIPAFTKDVKADYTGSSQDDSVKNILATKAVAKNGSKYIRVRLTLDGKVRFGALFKNEKKSAENQPDFTGSLDLDDEGTLRLRLAAWVKTGEKAGRYLSVAASEPMQKPAQDASKSSSTEVEDEEIPF